MGGKFCEMTTLMNYTYQWFNMRNKSRVRPYYDLWMASALGDSGGRA